MGEPRGGVSLARATRVIAFAVTMFMLAAADALAIPALTLDNVDGVPVGNPPFTLGWIFWTSHAIRVTGIGIFDGGQDGLVDSYAVGIWVNNGGTLIASGTVDSGTTDPLVNQFRYASISPVTLAPGVYHVGGLYLTSHDALVWPFEAENFATAPGITFLSAASSRQGGTLAIPGSTSSLPGYFGPNFEFTDPVPEPSTLLLIGSGLAGLAFRRCRRTPW
jgi:hypothetical protein